MASSQEPIAVLYNEPMPNTVLTIAGSEATGGAGAQADLKTFHSFNVFGIAALTCIVSFDPKNSWNHRFVPVDPTVIADQIEAATGAYPIERLNTIKIGMLGSPATIAVVAAALQQHQFQSVVLDPVLICKGQEPGHALDTDQALINEVLPRATFVTPNHFETERLAGVESIETVAQLSDAAKRIFDRSGATVLAKGGVRLSGTEAVDVFYDGSTLELLSAPKIGEVAVSGAGCTLAAAVTALLARGETPLEAARQAKTFVTRSIEHRVSSAAPFDAVWQGA